VSCHNHPRRLIGYSKGRPYFGTKINWAEKSLCLYDSADFTPAFFLSLHDALPIYCSGLVGSPEQRSAAKNILCFGKVRFCSEDEIGRASCRERVLIGEGGAR